MATARTPGVDPNGKIYEDTIPDTIARSIVVTQEITSAISAALANFTPTSGSTVDLTNTPIELRAVNGAYPGRPVTERPVIWKSWDVLPPAPGSTTSGTGPASIDTVELRAGVGVVTV